MIYIRKFLLFVLGFIFIPLVLALTTSFLCKLVDFNTMIYYFRAVFLVIYLSFPVLYRKDMPKRFPNKYAFYAMEYIIFWIFGIVLAL